MKKLKVQEKQIENPRVFFAVLLMLLISILIVLASSLGINKNDSSPPDKENLEAESSREDKIEPLDNYFGDISSSKSQSSNDGYIQADPFRETCDGTGAGKNPVVSFGTVCFR